MSGLIGARVKLFFDDTGKVLCKEGIILDESIIFIKIRLHNGSIQAIPTSKVVRVEVLYE